VTNATGWGRGAVVVGGVMTTQGDGKADHRAKGHSHDASRIEYWLLGNADCQSQSWRELARDGEPDALKGACPVREGLHRDRLFVRTSMAR
jgi:hypothetical protein